MPRRLALPLTLIVALLMTSGCLAPTSWSVVDEGVLLRSGQPNLEDLQTIRAETGLRTIVRLRTLHVDDQQTRTFARNNGINLVDIPIDRGDTPSPDDVQRFLQLFNDPANLPVLVHCAHGTERTGVMVALYRIYHERWSPEQAFREMKSNGFDALMNPKMKQYVRALPEPSAEQ
ncbi:MAG TPA: tyrosine-protein phosphatase [Phycisphaerae bacterium]|jgi:protein tyrosine/serine phosphatase